MWPKLGCITKLSPSSCCKCVLAVFIHLLFTGLLSFVVEQTLEESVYPHVRPGLFAYINLLVSDEDRRELEKRMRALLLKPQAFYLIPVRSRGMLYNYCDSNRLHCAISGGNDIDRRVVHRCAGTAGYEQ